MMHLCRVRDDMVEKYRLSIAGSTNILIVFGGEHEYDVCGIANAVTRATQREEALSRKERLCGGRNFEFTYNCDIYPWDYCIYEHRRVVDQC